MALLNTRLMANPANWFIAGLMVLFALMGVHVVASAPSKGIPQ